MVFVLQSGARKTINTNFDIPSHKNRVQSYQIMGAQNQQNTMVSSSPAADPSCFRVRLAKLCDVPALFHLVNNAYALERATDGPFAFKRGDRYNTQEDVYRDVEESLANEALPEQQRKIKFLVIESNQHGGLLCAAIRLLVVLDGDFFPTMDFGPFAVLPSFQGRRLGVELLRRAESWAREMSIKTLRIEVVNHRSDLFAAAAPGAGPQGTNAPSGFYAKHGFSLVGTAPCDAAHNTDESQLLKPSHFLILEKVLEGGTI